MLNPEVWIQGGTTMAVGMGIVFSFLVILVCAMFFMSNAVAWLNKVCPLPQTEEKTAKRTVKSSKSDEEVAIAIAIANAQ